MKTKPLQGFSNNDGIAFKTQVLSLKSSTKCVVQHTVNTQSLKSSFNSCGKRLIFLRIQVLHLSHCLLKAEILCFCKVKILQMISKEQLLPIALKMALKSSVSIKCWRQLVGLFLLVSKASSLMGRDICLTTLDATRLKPGLISAGLQAHGKQAPLVARIQTYKHRLLVTFRT